LKEWKFNPFNPAQGPRYMSQIISYTVYDKLPDGVLKVLKEKNPIVKNGKRKHKLFQYLTDDIGNPHLEKQLTAVTTLMRAAPDWRIFKMLFDRAFPEPNAQIEMNLDEEREVWEAIEDRTK
jgi:hypothetical protein